MHTYKWMAMQKWKTIVMKDLIWCQALIEVWKLIQMWHTLYVPNASRIMPSSTHFCCPMDPIDLHCARCIKLLFWHCSHLSISCGWLHSSYPSTGHWCCGDPFTGCSVVTHPHWAEAMEGNQTWVGPDGTAIVVQGTTTVTRWQFHCRLVVVNGLIGSVAWTRLFRAT